MVVLQEFTLGYAKFEIAIRHPVEKQGSLEFRGVVPAGSINLGLTR